VILRSQDKKGPKEQTTFLKALTNSLDLLKTLWKPWGQPWKPLKLGLKSWQRIEPHEQVKPWHPVERVKLIWLKVEPLGWVEKVQ
jgi:hypothetical protein